MRAISFALLFLSCGGAAGPPPAFAEEAAGESRSHLDREHPPRRAADGRLLVVALADGKPAPGVRIAGTFGDFVTRDDGSLSIDVPPGRYQMRVSGLEREIKFDIYEGEETQVRLHLLGESGGEFALSQPPKPVPEAGGYPADGAGSTVVPVHVVDEDGRPVPGASLLISSANDVLTTDSDGKAFVPLRTDKESVTAFHKKFETNSVLGALRRRGQDGTLQIRLSPAANELEEVVVLAPKIRGSVAALVEVRRSSSAVTDGLGSDQMVRAGDGDAAASLRRVTGLTLMGGKYVYVRGLGERYSGVQMNGFGLPSPEPARRVVPLDLFPTAILDSVLVQKSYSPDLPAEFGGGVIQLQTRSLPEKFFFKAGLTASFDDAGNRLAYGGGGKDWLGLDDGTRALPGGIRAALNAGKKFVRKQAGSSAGISEDELISLGRELRSSYNTRRANSLSLPGLTLATGDQFTLGSTRLGVATGLLYGQTVDQGKKSVRGYNVGSGGKLVPDFRDESEFAEVETRLAANLDLGWRLTPDQQIAYNTLLLRHTTNFTQAAARVSEAAPATTLEATTLEWTERQIWSHHLTGRHLVDKWPAGSVEFAWRAGLADAGRNSPDRREYTYDRTGDTYQMRDGSGGNKRTWSELVDRSRELGADLTLPLGPSPDRWKLKIGASHMARERRSDVFRFFFNRDWSGDSPFPLSEPPDALLSRDHVRSGGFLLQNLTEAADSYSGTQTVTAQYAVVDFSPEKRWTFQAGVRREDSRQTVKTYRYFEPGQPFAESQLNMVDALPAYSAVWKPDDHWRARLAYSETLARPEFREMSTVGFVDDDSGNEVQGNANLKGTVIRNLDHRWEYYLTTDEYASVGAFFKRFADPIEVLFVPGVNRIQTFDNAKAARAVGLEFETRVGLRNLSRSLRRFSFLFNHTWIRSRVELDDRNRGVQTSESRPLQGQAPYTTNIQLQYDRQASGLTATLLYNLVGERITEVGTNKVPDTYEQPVGQLDFVLTKTFAKNYSMGVKAKNLLDPLVESKQEDKVVRALRRGRSVGVGFSATF